MQRRSLRTARVLAAALAVAALVAAVPAASAQTAPKKTREQLQALQDAHKGDFDYLLGDWEFTAVRKMPDGPQKFRGYWSALRLDDGQVLDEYRVVSDEGETWYVTATLRNYNVFMDRWELVGASSGSGLLDFGTARREGDEVKIEQTLRRRERRALDPADPLPRHPEGPLLLDRRPLDGRRQDLGQGLPADRGAPHRPVPLASRPCPCAQQEVAVRPRHPASAGPGS